MAACSVSMDDFVAPLNPCSIESIPEPIELSDRSRVWPVMLGCYELQENGYERQGRLDLYSIQVPTDFKSSMNLRFGQPTPNNDQDLSGVLDGKWIPASNQPQGPTRYYFASAHSSGQIAIHQVREDDVYGGFPLSIELVTMSEPIQRKSAFDPAPLCLSLNWDISDSVFQEPATTRIVSTYSNGKVAVHNLVWTGPWSGLQLAQETAWDAHTMFTSPAEVWSAGFVRGGAGGTDIILSGGDEGSLKVWDLRSTHRPMDVLHHFEAGVTVVAPHPRRPNLVACGSYDETICLYDIRHMTKPMGHSGPLGGGIWRLKWHPYDNDRMLAACMHGGCRIVQMDQLEADKTLLVATKEFTEHKSMAYGADWLVCRHPTEDGYFEAAASCSFYDRAVYLWDSVA